MKYLYVLIIIFCYPLSMFSQLTTFTVSGTLKDVKQAKFAYLSTLSQRIPISSPEIFIKSQILNGKFLFNGTFDLKGKDYQHACVFVSERGNISKDELESKFRQLIWLVGRENDFRGIILEDVQLDSDSPDNLDSAIVVGGGFLTRQLDECSEAFKLKNRKMLEFVKKYPDSPISFDAVISITEPLPKIKRDRLNGVWGSPTELYNLLSERLRNSKKGQELKRMILQGDL
ncbi:hypothetical protein [Pedobacter sp. MR2016-24]|uniref:hypothetical protein n=1 Tax=Pedobacter sp. MR2016-24 TaxID=2994466 RepID=UPI002245411A|nr:hypothetical protein [Pedobacter sp. MR2016-24]MCX2485011.1 hypothetical protein [Pedobacter sp. MR2016-24]